MDTRSSDEAFYDALLDDDPEKLYDRAPCGYLTTTPDGTVVKANSTFLLMTGYTREALVGRLTFVEMLSVGGRIYHETHYAPLLRMQGYVTEVAFELVRPDGSRVPVLVNSALETEPDGTPVLVRVAVFDATQRREYERELLRAKQRAEASELRAQALARTLSATLIPPSPPRIPGLEVSAGYRPAGDGEEVGGDFYDIFQVGTDDWVVALGDVCGKGVQAAVVTSLVRHTLRALAVHTLDPSELLETLNDVLMEQALDRFCTAVVVRLRRHQDGAWTATLSAGGHPLPLLLPGAEQRIQVVGQPGSLIGVMPTVTCTSTTVTLSPGDLLVTYTDGVTEGRRGPEFYGDDRLYRSVVENRDAARPAEHILERVMDFQSGSARDDIAVVAIRVPTG